MKESIKEIYFMKLFAKNKLFFAYVVLKTNILTYMF